MGDSRRAAAEQEEDIENLCNYFCVKRADLRRDIGLEYVMNNMKEEEIKLSAGLAKLKAANRLKLQQRQKTLSSLTEDQLKSIDMWVGKQH